MTTASTGSQGMLPTVAGRKSLLAGFVDLYKGDLAFRGMTDFVVIGALVMLFLNPPHKVEWPWSGGVGAGQKASTNTGQTSGGGLLGGASGTATDPVVQGATTAGPVVAIPFPNALKNPRLGVGFLFDIDEKPFESSSADDQPRLKAALTAVALRQPDDIMEQLRAANGEDPNVVLLRGAAFTMRDTADANRTAEALWRQAANGGNTQAKALLGRLLVSGKPGVKANAAEGQQLLEAGVAAGDRQAMRFVGIGYLSGDLGLLDPAKAAELLKQAADAGDAMAMAVYSRMLAEGIGVPSSDGKQAEHYLRGAANAGLTLAQITLGEWLTTQYAQGLVPDPKEAIDWFTKAHEKGHAVDALIKLAHLHAAVAKTPPWKDLARSMGYSRQCSGFKHATCQFNNALAWRNGFDGNANLALARAHFEIARTLGFGDAAAQLKRLDSTLTQPQRDAADAYDQKIRARLKPVPPQIPLQYAGIPSPPPPEAVAPEFVNSTSPPSSDPKKDVTGVSNTADYKLCVDTSIEFKKRGEACDRIIKEDKGSPSELADAFFGRAWMKDNLKQSDEAIADYTQAVKLVPELAAALNNRGSKYITKREYDKAIEDFDQALKIQPKHKHALANKAEVLRRQGKLSDALSEARKALEIDGKFAWARNVHDAILDDIKRLESGGKPKPTIEKDDGSSAEVKSLRKRAESHLTNKDYDSALADFTDLIRKGNASWQDYHGRGKAYHFKKQFDYALKDYDRAISRSGHDAIVHVNRAFIYKNKGNVDAALSDLDAAIDQHGSVNLRHYLERGSLRLQKSAYVAAIKDYDKVVELLSKDKTASAEDRAVGYFLRGRAKLDVAAGEVNKCKSMIPPDPNCSSPARYMLALLDFEQALLEKPNYAEAHFQKGMIAANIGNNKQAVASYTKAIKASPHYSMAFNNRGVVYANMKQRELAFADYNDAIRSDPKNKFAWANRASLFASRRGRKNRRRAVADYRQALSIDPNYAYAADGLRKLGVRR